MAEDVGGTQTSGVKKSSKKTFTPAERIQQLNEIDKDVARLLSAAGLAIKSLTTSPPPSTTSPHILTAHKTAFTTATTTYFTLLQSISLRLKSQILALENADIIAPEPPAADKAAAAAAAAAAGGAGGGGVATVAVTGVTGTGLGGLDVGWLNSNLTDGVGREMERELWAKARSFFEGLERARGGEKGGEDGGGEV